MIDTLYVNGCSWTAGNELEQSPEFFDHISKLGLEIEDINDPANWNLVDKNKQVAARFEDFYDNFNWGGTVKKNLQIPNLVNHALGAASNRRILRTTTKYLKQADKEQLKQTLVVIGWTVSERSEIYIERDSGAGWQVFNATQPFSMTYDRRVAISHDDLVKLDEFQKFHTAYVYNDYSAVFDYFQCIYLLSNLLENLQVPYLFFNALPPWWMAGEYKTRCDVFQEFSDEINWHTNHPNILHFDNSMYGFVNSNNFTLGKYLHPLADAHSAWGDYLTKAIKSRL